MPRASLMLRWLLYTHFTPAALPSRICDTPLPRCCFSMPADAAATASAQCHADALLR